MVWLSFVDICENFIVIKKIDVNKNKYIFVKNKWVYSQKDNKTLLQTPKLRGTMIILTFFKLVYLT